MLDARTATIARYRTTNATELRSSFVSARIAEMPSKLSRGVLSQNNASAAVSSRTNGNTFVLWRNATPAAVTMGTSSKPQAPCSRGTISARLRSRRAFSMADSCSAQPRCAPSPSRVLPHSLLPLSPSCRMNVLHAFDRAHVLSTFERRWIRAFLLAHAALHLPDGFVFVLFHPLAQFALRRGEGG